MSPAAPYRTPSPPPITAPDHTGERRPDAVYWTDPPPMIGELVSAWSNQTPDGFVKIRGLRALIILAIVFVPIAVAFLYTSYDWWGIPGLAGCVVVIGGLGAAMYIESKQRPWCSFLGADGFSEHRVTWRRVDHTVVRFSDVAGVWVERTEHYTNGVYQNTSIEYEWRSATGMRLARRRVTLAERGMAAAGARFGSGGNPRRDPTNELMTAATEAWRQRRLVQAEQELAEHGAVVFPTRTGGFFTIRPGSIETNASGQTATIRPSDIQSVKLDAGVATIKTERGKIRFAISAVADFPLAFALAEQVAGLSLLG